MSEESTKKSFSLTKYNSSIQRLLKAQVPKVWVMAEISQITPRGGLVYINLSEHEEGKEKPIATLSVYAYSNDFQNFEAKFRAVDSNISLRKDMKICVLLEADFYVPHGKIQPKICDIDPVYSLGELARTRKAILNKLREEGLIDLQKQLKLPLIPLRLGLITAPQSAAHADFSKTLFSSNFAIQIILAEARMQGDSTSKDIVKGIKFLNEEKVDLICIIRGGGSKTDLVWFDNEELCRAIALSPVPILTGIGHQIDHSLADEVSAIQGITPTASAEWILERLYHQYNRLEEINRYLLDVLYRGIKESKEQFKNNSLRLNRSIKSRLNYSAKILKQHKMSLAKVYLKRELSESSKIELMKSQMLKVNSRVDFQEKLKLSRFKDRLLKSSERFLKINEDHLNLNINGFEKGSNKILRFNTKELKHHHQSTQSKIAEFLLRNKEKLSSYSKELRALDPKRTLERGYAIVRSKDTGKIAKFESLNSDSILETEFLGGVVRSQVLSKELKEKND